MLTRALLHAKDDPCVYFFLRNCAKETCSDDIRGRRKGNFSHVRDAGVIALDTLVG